MPQTLLQSDQKSPAKLAVRYIDKDGKHRVTGSDQLKESQSYPERTLRFINQQVVIARFQERALGVQTNWWGNDYP